MKPLYVRQLTKEEEKALKKGLQSASAFTVRRSQIVSKSAAGQKASQIAEALCCSDQTVRNTLKAFEAEGLGCLQEKSHARHDQQPEIDEAGLARLRELIKETPRRYGYASSRWTCAWLGQQLYAEGLTKRLASAKMVGRALKRAGVKWQRAKRWLRSPDAHYERRKKDGIG